jgi:hypothetical protein
MNKKKKTDNSYVNMFKLKKIENSEKIITTEKTKGINFDNITDWDNINYDGKKQAKISDQNENGEFNKFPCSEREKNTEVSINKLKDNYHENKQDKEYHFDRNIHLNRIPDQYKITKISYNSTTQPKVNKNHIGNFTSSPVSIPIQENQNDDFSVDTSNFTNRIGDNAANQIDRIDLSQNNFQTDFNAIKTNILNKKILPFNSTDTIGDNYKNIQAFDKKYEIIEENEDEEGKMNPSDFVVENIGEEKQQDENQKNFIKCNTNDSDSDDSNFALSINHDLNVTSNQLEDMNNELKNINYNVKLTQRINNLNEVAKENKNRINNNSGKIKLQPINKKKRNSKINKEVINEIGENELNKNQNNQEDKIPKTPNYKLQNNLNSNPVSIQTYQNNMNIMNVQPSSYYNPQFSTINQMSLNNLNNQYQVDPNIAMLQPMHLQMPFNTYSYNQIQPIYNQPNFYGNPYAQVMIPNNFSNFGYTPGEPTYQNVQTIYNPQSPNVNDLDKNNVDTKKIESCSNKSESIKKSKTYKPYTYVDYKLKYDGNKIKLGGLGANIGTKEWEEKYQKKRKMKEYTSNFKAIPNCDNTGSKEHEKENSQTVKEKSDNKSVLDSPTSDRNEPKKLNEQSFNDSSLNLEQRIFRDLNIANNINDVITNQESSLKEKEKKSSISHVHNLIKLKEDKKSLNKNEIEEKSKIRAKSSIKNETINKTQEKKLMMTNVYTTIHTEKENMRKNKKIEKNSQILSNMNSKAETIRKSRPVSSKIEIVTKEDGIEDDDPYVRNFYSQKKDEYDHLDNLLKQHKNYSEKVENIKKFIYKLN